ncbi:PAS domain-containing sensor histidine kinase [bacterium D16-50]|nr:PAS domain-containing sensor histidine kinase [bacterium D16-50]
MYHCHLRLYLAGRPCRAFEIMKEMTPLEHFTHEFSESSRPDGALAAEAGAIFVNLQEMEIKEALDSLIKNKSADAELILLVDRERLGLLEDSCWDAKDIWVLPASDRELRFRFLRWQQTYKTGKDFWETSHFLDATINNVPNLVWYKDKNGIHEKVNDAFCRTVNKEKAQVEGRGHAYIWNVEHDDPACIESERMVMLRKSTCISDEIVQSGDEKKILTTYKSPLYDVDGSVMGTVGVAMDVTQERSYEKEITNKNRALETMFTAMDCGVICHSLDGARILSINKAALRLLGYESSEEMIAEGFHMVAPTVLEEDGDMVREHIRRLKKDGDSVGVEYRVRHKSGELLHIMGNIKLIEENGELFYQRFLLDCTEQKNEERQKERRQKELIQALSMDYNLVCFYNLDTGKGMRLRDDDEDDALFGGVFTEASSLDESMEMYVHRFVHEEDKEMFSMLCSGNKIRQELSQKKLYSVNYRTLTAKGMKYFQVKIVRAGSWDESHGVVLGFHSVDEETRSEMEKKSLLEDALSQANKASKAKTVFLSNMSHDIRTPMNAIIGFTALAITHIDRKDQVEEYLKKIMTSGNHLLSLINDVLDMSRIESGKINLEEKSCSLPEVLHSLCNIVQADIHAKQLELHIDAVDVINEQVYCDRLRLNQVLLNLLSNSIKYTGAGGIVSMRISEKGGAPAGYAKYEFRVRDNGIGMSPEFLEHIFEPFEREATSTISRIQGTGLGMAITKNIVDMMNGTIEVKSQQGVGTEFIVSLMFRLHSGPKEAMEIPALKNCRALVVDDDFNTCDSVSYMLQQFGMRAEWTLSGKEAVLRTRQAVMRGDDYCVYIIDWLLPDMNGIEVVRRIRKETGEDVPIIILTAYDWSDIEEEAKEAGVTAFCGKPLFLSELRNCLHSVVGYEEEKEKNVEKKPVKFQPGRILLAEDVELNQEIAVAILGDAGFTTEVAENGRIALDMLTKSTPGYYQVVLMDVQMPVMNGYDAARAIRSLENKELASIPIVAMTANAFEEDRQAALQSGMNGHIAKPIDVDNLFGTLGSILG